MFTPAERERVRRELLARADEDSRIVSAAVTGSAAENREDEWSDIDLAFAVTPDADIADVIADWSNSMYHRHRAVHHTDIKAGPWIYRVFLLANRLQVDLAFVAAAEFRPLAPSFRLIFGEAGELQRFPQPQPVNLIGLAWLHALHARSAIARGRLWQAEYMISGIRNHALMLASIRHGLPTAHGRGLDQLPEPLKNRFRDSLVRQLEASELMRAFRSLVPVFIEEVVPIDAALADTLTSVLMSLTDFGTAESRCA